MSLALIAIVVVGGYAFAFHDRILPNTTIGTVEVGGLTREKARERVEEQLSQIQKDGIVLDIEGKQEIIQPDAIGLSALPEALVDAAWSRGRGVSLPRQMATLVTSSFLSFTAPAEVHIDRERLEDEIIALSEIIDQPRKDIRFNIVGTKVDIHYDTKPGRILDVTASADLVAMALRNLNAEPVHLVLVDDVPRASRESVTEALRQAERIMGDALVLVDERYRTTIDRVTIGKWIIPSYEGDRLIPAVDTRELSRYITQIAEHTDIAPRKPTIDVINGKVTSFTPPSTGRALEQGKTVALISDILMARRAGETPSRELKLPVKPVKPASETIAGIHEGIVEMIGTATTPFTGSPANRQSNIKNGAKFMSGVLLAPGEEFSTLKTLGRIDNTTGYLPELVIKGDRTTPEFGGGLCQVSTTLFRAVLDAGLPVTARRNHSFRISYYEKDGTGAFIGPGLDASIYEPSLDFKFKNDTTGSILLYAYVVGDKITFELYGSHDGRTAVLKGPRTLSEVPPGDPIYTETDTLPRGTTKQVEIPHPGATTVADYTVTYPDGKVVAEQFKSYYRRWPAQFLVGTRD